MNGYALRKEVWLSMNKSDFLDKNKTSLDNYARLSRYVGGRVDFTQGGGGNTSVKLQDNIMAIKASGYKLRDIRADEGYALMDYQGVRDFYKQHAPEDFEDLEKAGNAHAQSTVVPVDGIEPKRPSVESGFHALLQNYVVHVHCVYANLLTCCVQGRDVAAKIFKDAPYACGYIDYCNPGTLLSFNMWHEAQRVRKETSKAPNVIFMQNHGVTIAHDDPDICKQIFLDVCDRCARAFSIDLKHFPGAPIQKVSESVFKSNNDFLKSLLKHTQLDDGYFFDTALYPDQLVYLAGNVAIVDGDQSDKKITINRLTGDIIYRAAELDASSMDETLLAVLYIMETIKRSPYDLSTMDQKSKAFITGWESEHYRQRILNQK